MFAGRFNGYCHQTPLTFQVSSNIYLHTTKNYPSTVQVGAVSEEGHSERYLDVTEMGSHLEGGMWLCHCT